MVGTLKITNTLIKHKTNIMENALSNKREEVNFIKIIAETGKFHMEVPEGTEGAIIREGSVNGKDYRKVEKTFDTLAGKIRTIDVKEGEYGTNLYIKISDIILGANTEGSFAQDLMKKIPNIDLNIDVILQPYSFTNDKGKDVRGVTVKQVIGDEEVKIENFFYDKKTKKEAKGYPVFPTNWEKYTKDQWKAYRLEVLVFLKKYITDNYIYFTDEDDKAISESNKTADAEFEGKTDEEIADEFEGKKENKPGIKEDKKA